MKGLGVGRIVHFFPPTVDHSVGEPQAAIVTRLSEKDGNAEVAVFPGGEVFSEVPFAKVPTPYSWRWPEKI